MPTNLNALIRFKQIDLCLRSPLIVATIDVLIKKCSASLEHSRGVVSVSERTIREDIRVMRSDILGFNAPIVVKNGVYSYEDEDYSIFNTSINEMDLLIKIVKLLIEERENIKNPKLDGLLEELTSITGVKIGEEKPEREEIFFESYQKTSNYSYMDTDNSNISFKDKPKMKSNQSEKLTYEYQMKKRSMLRSVIEMISFFIHKNMKRNMHNKEQKPSIYLWEDIFELL